MSLLRFFTLLIVTIVGTLTPAVVAAEPTTKATTKPVPARQPLTYKDSGIYGWWQPYFWEGPFDYVITQAIILPGDFGPTKVTNNCSTLENIKEWNQSLLKARAAGKRVLVVVSPGQGESFKEPYYKALEQFLANINHEELYAISLGEENIPAADWVAALSDFYHRIKKKYPDLPVYQWYTCSSRAMARPGFSYPLLPSDGWLSDEYVATPDDFEQAMRRYRMIGLPVINIIWAAPFYSSSRATSVPFHSGIFDGQVRVSQKYNIPTAYFCWDGPAAAGRTHPWDKEGQKENKDLFKTVLEKINEAKTLPEESLLDWDDAAKPVKTVLEKENPNTLQYREHFELATVGNTAKAPKHDFMERMQIRGLRHLKWAPDPARIQAVADSGGKPIDASIINHWVTPDGQKCRMDASVSVKLEPGTVGALVLEVSTNGYDWVGKTSELRDGILSVELPEAVSELHTRLRISGTADKPGQPIATIHWIEVRGEISK
jgi:hypothetical protein